jgi:hypothetical protein
MVSNLESKVLQGVGDTGLVLEPASGLDQESDGGSGLTIVDGSDLDTAGRVDYGSKRACETRGIANGGGRCSQHCWAGGRGKWKSEGSRWWAPEIPLTRDSCLPFRRSPMRTLIRVWSVKTL